jgi:pantoate--beta-alanine ligase
MTTLIKSLNDIKKAINISKRDIGFVPTMGALHDGHISLIKACKQECKTTFVSIFVNPKQFSPGEDFDKYPRDFEADLKICKELNVDYIFSPDVSEIYPEKVSEEIVTPPTALTEMLCGLSRKDFFPGVATVVKKLLEIVTPDYAYFGEKDLQQLFVIRWLVKEYKIPTFIRACPIVREKNGLACSSRNRYLNEDKKKLASHIHKSLEMARRDVRSGIFTASKAALESLVYLSQFPDIKVEYLESRSKENLEKVTDGRTKGFYFLVAARVGNVRLIDNIEV